MKTTKTSSGEEKNWMLGAEVPSVEPIAATFEDDPIAIRDAIAGLTVTELHAIAVQGKLFAIGTSWTADDLVQESVVRTMDGRRQWNKKLTMLQHLSAAARSIAYAERSSQKWEVPFIEVETQEGEARLVEPHTDLDPERIMMAKESLAEIQKACADEPEILAFLECMMREAPSTVRSRLGSKLFCELRSKTRRKLIRHFPDLEPQMRKTRRTRTKSMVVAFECMVCSARVLRTGVGDGKMRWVCEGCQAPFGPAWVNDEPETRLVGMKVWTDEPKPLDPAEKVHVEFRERRGGETWWIWGEKCRGEWTFMERPDSEIRKTEPVECIIPRLTENAEGVLRRAGGLDDSSEDSSLADYVKCIIENNVKRLSDQMNFAWT